MLANITSKWRIRFELNVILTNTYYGHISWLENPPQCQENTHQP